jgi:hypothetical protein
MSRTPRRVQLGGLSLNATVYWVALPYPFFEVWSLRAVFVSAAGIREPGGHIIRGPRLRRSTRLSCGHCCGDRLQCDRPTFRRFASRSRSCVTPCSGSLWSRTGAWTICLRKSSESFLRWVLGVVPRLAQRTPRPRASRSFIAREHAAGERDKAGSATRSTDTRAHLRAAADSARARDTPAAVRSRRRAGNASARPRGSP